MTPGRKGHQVRGVRMALGVRVARVARVVHAVHADQRAHKDRLVSLGPKVTRVRQGRQALKGPLVRPDR